MQFAAEKRAARALALAVQQPTLAGQPDTPFTQLHTVLRELFPQFFSKAETQWTDGRAMLLRLPGVEDAPPLLFLSHLDVAPILQPDQWESLPFSGEIRDGFVYGRGTADMKGHLIALLTAAETLLETGARPRADLYFAFSSDEEVRGGSMRQMADFLKARNIRPAFALDEGGAVTGLPALLEKNAALVGVCEKGRMRFTLTAQGENAPEALLRSADRLLRMRFSPRIAAPVGAMLEALSGEMAGFPRFCAAHPRLMRQPLLQKLEQTHYGRALTHTELRLSALRGDARLGETAAMTFQAAILPGESARELLGRVERVIGDDRILVTVDEMDEPSAQSPAQGRAWDALTTAIQVHFPGVAIAPYLLTDASDARRMEEICPFVYRFSPFILPADEMRRMHRPNERLSIENLLRGAAFFRQMLLS